MSAPNRARGLAVVVLSLVVVAVIAARESISGLETVASTASGVAAFLLLLVVVAVVMKVVSRHSDSRWPRLGLGGLAIASVALVVVVLVSVVRGHTASGRFADEAARFPLPSSYEVVSAAGADVGNLGEPEHTVRVWRVPTGANACKDVERAFKAWTERPAVTFSRAGDCTISSYRSRDQVEIAVTDDGSTVVLEMWLEGTSLIHF